MKQSIIRILLRVLLIAVILSCGHKGLADTYTFSLLPLGGNVSGYQGSTIGWGYSIINNSSSEWLVTADLTSSPFANGTADASPFDFPVIPPGATASEEYDPARNVGLYALLWSSSAPVGFVNSGVFTLSAEWWSGDPSTEGNFLQDAPDETAAFTATVTSPAAPSTIPEPAPITYIIVAAIVGFACVLRRDVSVTG